MYSVTASLNFMEYSPAFEATGRIEGQSCRRRAVVASSIGKDAGFDERLKSVAHPNHRFARIHESCDLIGEVHVEVEGQQLARAERVGIREPSGLECMRRLQIAI